METETPESPRADFSDDEFSSDPASPWSETSAPPTPRPESEAGYSASEDDDDDDDDGDSDDNVDNIQQPDEDEDELPWRTTSWLEDAIRESVGKVEKYNERMGLLAQEKGDENYPIEWDELRGNFYREMRYQEGLRSDLDKLLARKTNR